MREIIAPAPNPIHQDTIQISWCIEDVLSVADDLDDNQAREVLRLAKAEHDANVGINWEVLEIWANYVRTHEIGDSISNKEVM